MAPRMIAAIRLIVVGASICTPCYLIAAAPDSGASGATTAPVAPKIVVAPAPELSPEQVVKAQMEALQNNDDKDSGIAVAFQFASPDNKSQTGPLDRFAEMVKGEAYAPMLGCKALHYSESHIKDDQASEIVSLRSTEGKLVQYRFTLSKQHDGPQKGCWMTDGVQRLEAAEPPKAA